MHDALPGADDRIERPCGYGSLPGRWVGSLGVLGPEQLEAASPQWQTFDAHCQLSPLLDPIVTSAAGGIRLLHAMLMLFALLFQRPSLSCCRGSNFTACCSPLHQLIFRSAMVGLFDMCSSVLLYMLVFVAHNLI